MKRGNIVVTAMVGIVTGLIIGVLFAPYKGTKTRRKIAKKGEELTVGIINKWNKFGEFIHEKLDVRPSQIVH